MGLTYDQLFAGRFLKAGEFGGKDVTLTITNVYLEDLEQDDGTEKHQAVVSFKETKREWALNKTNAQCLVAMWGTCSDGWLHRKVTLHAEPDKSGKSDSGLCIRVLGSPELTAPIAMQVKLPRRKAIKRTLQPTAKTKAPSTDEFAEVPVPAPFPDDDPGVDRCVGCLTMVTLTPDATDEDVAAMRCEECGGEMERP